MPPKIICNFPIDDRLLPDALRLSTFSFIYFSYFLLIILFIFHLFFFFLVIVFIFIIFPLFSFLRLFCFIFNLLFLIFSSYEVIVPLASVALLSGCSRLVFIWVIESSSSATPHLQALVVGSPSPVFPFYYFPLISIFFPSKLFLFSSKL